MKIQKVLFINKKNMHICSAIHPTTKVVGFLAHYGNMGCRIYALCYQICPYINIKLYNNVPKQLQ